MGYLRIRQLPVEEFYNTVMIVKLEYKKLPKRFLDASVSDARIEEGQIHKQAMD
jgi:hypothetical protein